MHYVRDLVLGMLDVIISGDPNKSNFKHRQLNVNFFIGMSIKCMVICNALGRGITKIKGLGQGSPQV